MGRHEIRNDSIPAPLRQAGVKIQAVAIHQLMSHFNLGWGKWIPQLISGPPTTGVIRQVGVRPHSDKAKPPIPPKMVWGNSSKRFNERACRSGFKNALPLRGEEIPQVHLERLSDPIPIDNSGRVQGFSLEGANSAFRFGVEQDQKLRACGDLKQNMANLRTSVYTPIALPTWGHISEMAKRIRGSKRAWGFFKADHKGAYKQLLLDQEYANLTLAALRRPTPEKWFAFAPKVMLFGEVSAAIRYNCCAVIFAVLANKIPGIPAFNYFGDFGSLVPDLVKLAGSRVFLGFTAVLGALTKDDKSQVGQSLAFLGLWGEFPNPDNDMLLRISLPEYKKENGLILRTILRLRGGRFPTRT